MIDAVAFHEAGHAVIALAVGLGVERASADPADPGVTTTVPADLPPGKRSVLKFVARIFVDLAGAAAEERAFGTADDEAQRPDEENALRRAAQLLRLARDIGDRRLDVDERATCERLVAAFRPTAAKLVAENWPAIEAVAAALAVADGPLSGDAIDALIASAS